MSRIGKKIIEIPSGVEVKFNSPELFVKGPKGEIKKTFDPRIEVVVSSGKANVNIIKDLATMGPMWGTVSSHLSNMIEGVTKGFEKKLQIEGVGYKADVKGDLLILNVGYSHPVKIKIPNDLKVTVEKNFIVISGPSKDSVGSFSAYVRDQKKPEPYKGKGIRYFGEVIKIKQGKKSV